jgi:hypothetical protein
LPRCTSHSCSHGWCKCRGCTARNLISAPPSCSKHRSHRSPDILATYPINTTRVCSGDTATGEAQPYCHHHDNFIVLPRPSILHRPNAQPQQDSLPCTPQPSHPIGAYHTSVISPVVSQKIRFRERASTPSHRTSCIRNNPQPNSPPVQDINHTARCTTPCITTYEAIIPRSKDETTVSGDQTCWTMKRTEIISPCIVCFRRVALGCEVSR